MKHIVVALALGAASLPGSAMAQLEFDAEAPRVFSIQARPYRPAHEFQIGVGALPLDAFYVGFALNASYTYHFSDFWAWEMVNLGYSFNQETGLRARLDELYDLEPVQGGGERVRIFGTTSLVIKPLFGKLALLNEKIISAETFFTIGAGPFLKGDRWRPSSVLGAGIRFWIADVFSLRVDAKDYLVFSEGYKPENHLLLLVSAAFTIGRNSQGKSNAK